MLCALVFEEVRGETWVPCLPCIEERDIKEVNIQPVAGSRRRWNAALMSSITVG